MRLWFIPMSCAAVSIVCGFGGRQRQKRCSLRVPAGLLAGAAGASGSADDALLRGSSFLAASWQPDAVGGHDFQI
jgi:hypothetical protein